MAKTVERVCKCGTIFHPRVADVKRGWGTHCSKKCKAIKQTHGTIQPTIQSQPSLRTEKELMDAYETIKQDRDLLLLVVASAIYNETRSGDVEPYREAGYRLVDEALALIP